MAVGFGLDLDENVENLIERPKKKFVKSPRYKSIHNTRTRRELAKVKSAHKTLGEPRTPLKPPSAFLRKGERKPPQPKASRHKHYRKPGFTHKLPEWTPVRVRVRNPCQEKRKVEDLPQDSVTIRGLDFKRRNIESLKKLQPPKPKPRIVHTRKGDVLDLVASGLMPVYIYKKSYGEVPARVKRGASAPAHGEKCRKVEDYEEKPANTGCRYITEDERAQLLEGMKMKWLELMKQFQCLPFVIDTVPKIKRKASLEEKLKQIEKDIELIENHQYIYVYDNNANRS